ncbi:MAG TPA: hypothetical protein VK882_07525 [Nitrososphaeraceae archaeon]|jgi:hypothetical protein|nr:hypothetical protein [Nitrososphaeraceae archaeon]
MVVVTDSFMGIFTPIDIPSRIIQFIEKKIEFPFIKENEIVGIFYLFGKDNKVTSDLEILSVRNIAKRTMEQQARNIKIFHEFKENKLDSKFIREEYNKRILQISIEEQISPSSTAAHMSYRIAGDPTIQSNCFEQHITYYKQDYFYELFKQPFKKTEVPSHLISKLEKRMLMLCYNVSDSSKLPYNNTVHPFFEWLNDSDK